MKLKVRIDGIDHIIDPNENPVAIYFKDDADRTHHLKNMDMQLRVYCVRPDTMDKAEVLKFMEGEYDKLKPKRIFGYLKWFTNVLSLFDTGRRDLTALSMSVMGKRELPHPTIPGAVKNEPSGLEMHYFIAVPTSMEKEVGDFMEHLAKRLNR